MGIEGRDLPRDVVRSATAAETKFRRPPYSGGGKRISSKTQARPVSTIDLITHRSTGVRRSFQVKRSPGSI